MRSRESESTALRADGRGAAQGGPRRQRGGAAGSRAAPLVGGGAPPGGLRRLQLQRALGRVAAVLAGAALAVGAAPASAPLSPPRVPPRGRPRRPGVRRRRLVGDGGGLVPRGAARGRGDAAALPGRAPRRPPLAPPRPPGRPRAASGTSRLSPVGADDRHMSVHSLWFQECACASCAAAPAPPPSAPSAAALPPARSLSRPDRLSFTLKKEAQGENLYDIWYVDMISCT